MSHRVVSLILGGGRGTRLAPLTKVRSKPAVPIGGKYRLIDIPISNCIHSEINRIYVLTQFNSVSLHHHIANTYKFDAFGRGFVELLAAQQTMDNERWYQGTADAVRRHISSFNIPSCEMVLILSGDQLYRMDFQEMMRAHREKNADISIAVLPVSERDATACGVMKLDTTGRVTAFTEKPKTPEALAAVRTEPEWMERLGIASRGRSYLASMGIYLFNRRLLVEMLENGHENDFGKEVFPMAIQKNHHVQAHLFDGYWEDIGTIGAFHKANIDLTRDDPPFNFLQADQPIYTHTRYLGSSRVLGATVDHSLIADGCTIGQGCVIENSVIGVRAQIGANVTIRNTYIMGADYYESAADREAALRSGKPTVGIGDNSEIRNAIIDKNARIGRNVRILNDAGVVDAPEDRYCTISDKIVVVPKLSVIPDGTVI